MEHFKDKTVGYADATSDLLDDAKDSVLFNKEPVYKMKIMTTGKDLCFEVGYEVK